MYFLFALFSDEPEVFLPEYSKPAILHAAHFWRVVNGELQVWCVDTDSMCAVPESVYSNDILLRGDVKILLTFHKESQNHLGGSVTHL